MKKSTKWIPTMAEVERSAILGALKTMEGNRTHTALRLGISLRNLKNKMKIYKEQGFFVPPPQKGVKRAVVQ